jgi:dTDP-glucose 4,6-dehydratase
MELGASAGAFRRVVVLGGAGFVGSHVSDRLLRDGSAVVYVGDHSTGDARNVGHLTDDDRFETVDGVMRALRSFRTVLEVV